MKLSNYAKLNGVTYMTAYRWFNQGLIPNSKQLAIRKITPNEVRSTIKSFPISLDIHNNP